VFHEQSVNEALRNDLAADGSLGEGYHGPMEDVFAAGCAALGLQGREVVRLKGRHRGARCYTATSTPPRAGAHLPPGEVDSGVNLKATSKGLTSGRSSFAPGPTA
jgi:hypothetical protein